MNTRIRTATLADLDALLALEALFPVDRMSRRSLRRALTSPQADCQIIVRANQVLGYGLVFYRHNSRTARLYSIILGPAYRGQGLADALLEALEAAASQRGCQNLRLEVQTGNTAAIRFYRRHGYTDDGLRPGYYDDGSDALRLRKILKP